MSPSEIERARERQYARGREKGFTNTLLSVNMCLCLKIKLAHSSKRERKTPQKDRNGRSETEKKNEW